MAQLPVLNPQWMPNAPTTTATHGGRSLVRQSRHIHTPHAAASPWKPTANDCQPSVGSAAGVCWAAHAPKPSSVSAGTTAVAAASPVLGSSGRTTRRTHSASSNGIVVNTASEPRASSTLGASRPIPSSALRAASTPSPPSSPSSTHAPCRREVAAATTRRPSSTAVDALRRVSASMLPGA